MYIYETAMYFSLAGKQVTSGHFIGPLFWQNYYVEMA
jgi:hypothetical protein